MYVCMYVCMYACIQHSIVAANYLPHLVICKPSGMFFGHVDTGAPQSPFLSGDHFGARFGDILERPAMVRWGVSEWTVAWDLTPQASFFLPHFASVLPRILTTVRRTSRCKSDLLLRSKSPPGAPGFPDGTSTEKTRLFRTTGGSAPW